ncbi:hypothetical protein ACFQWB_14505 [Paenibacillus thermoaerophilus]|uniref:Uncharacterized protein n=1 Tax=Paenibacillus thermoaerophilus TaxID=1215385 RepID=A0ABW2V4S1_9BACL|nr:hypothetical protein [Paenibacillus thermoaerophilus]TMV12527.1 hypothetical protein FE781_11890 [Paenibacillus thermoaerophilus]
MEMQMQTDPQTLVAAWNETLPSVLNFGDKATVAADEQDPNTLRMTIDSAGHTGYSFDFKCTYVDSREVRVEFVDVERGNRNIDEFSPIVQSLIDDYVRHIHECAQALHGLTHGN